MKQKKLYLCAISAFLAAIICLGSFVGCKNGDSPTISPSKEEKGTSGSSLWLPTVKLPEYAEYLVEHATYPKMAKYPSSDRGSDAFKDEYKKWSDDKKDRLKYLGSWEGLDEFYLSTVSEFLSDTNGKNAVYSPVNVYMALAMLAETTDKNSRAQILSLLGADSIDALRDKAHSIWNASYSDDGAVTSIIANSVWLDSELDPNDETLKLLAKKYYASTFSGEMGSDELNKALREWINEQTGGLLEDMTDGIELDENTILTLASTVYFQAKWANEFQIVNTEENIFHSPNGDVLVDFMRRTDMYGKYYFGGKFSATSKSLEGSGNMYFILPDEDVTVDELLHDTEALNFIASNGNWENKKTIKVNLSVPKFDVSSNTDLAKGLKALGVTDCFDKKAASFAPLISVDGESWVSSVEHGVRVAIDEKGVTAAAYTVIPVCGDAAPPIEEVDFVLDRPFVFVITGSDGIPMFVGVVNQP